MQSVRACSVLQLGGINLIKFLAAVRKMLRQFDEGLLELRRGRNFPLFVPEWSLVLISALIQSWEIFSDYFVGKYGVVVAFFLNSGYVPGEPSPL